jgi:hypothetical protein
MRALMAATYLAWVCAAIGLFTRPAKILTAAGMLLALGFEQAYETGSNHSHYLLLYSLVLLSFSTSDQAWSVDAWLRRRRPHAPVPDDGATSLAASGLPRNAVLIAAVSLYFASGLGKLSDAGLRWVDGQSLQYYIGSQVDRTSFELVTLLRTWVSEQRWLCAIMSAGTLVIEMGSPLALFSRRLRHLWIPAWIGMHFGIVLLMAPNYWIHSWCVGILLTDWAWLRRALEARSFRAADSLSATPFAGAPRLARRGYAVAVLFLLLTLIPPVAQIEWFPLTHVPMYASYVTPAVIGGVPVEDFGDEARVREIARRCAGGRTIGYLRRCPWRLPRALVDRLSLELVGPGGEPVRFSNDLGGLRYPAIARLAGGTPREQAETAAMLTDHVRGLLHADTSVTLPDRAWFRLEYRLSEGTIQLAEGAVGASR